jgi:hypothetical protein
MAKIYSYTKQSDQYTTFLMEMPRDQDGQTVGTELCTINGVTYVSIPDSAALPAQRSEVSYQLITPTPELAQQIKLESQHVHLINSRVAEKIAAEYSLADEIKLLRTAPSAEFELYNAHAEACRAWGREEKAKLGL